MELLEFERLAAAKQAADVKWYEALLARKTWLATKPCSCDRVSCGRCIDIDLVNQRLRNLEIRYS